MKYLSFTEPPRYIYSNNKQFLPHEKHMKRLFDEDVLIIMFDGVLRFTENGEALELKAGEYYIQRAGFWQDGPIESDVPRYYYVHFKGTYTNNEGLPIRGTFDTADVRRVIDSLRNLGFYATALEYNLNFYYLLHKLLQGQKKSTDAEILRAYIIANYQNKITLEDLAKLIPCSVNQVNHIFKATHETTAIDYLISYRLATALELIVTTNRPITEISQYVGFTNYPVFYRLFEKRFGLSPKECRTNKIKLSHVTSPVITE